VNRTHAVNDVIKLRMMQSLIEANGYIEMNRIVLESKKGSHFVIRGQLHKFCAISTRNSQNCTHMQFWLIPV